MVDYRRDGKDRIRRAHAAGVGERTVGAWVFRNQMSTDDHANLVPSEASYTLVPRLSVRQYDSPPVSTGMLRLMTSL